MRKTVIFALLGIALLIAFGSFYPDEIFQTEDAHSARYDMQLTDE